MVKDSVKLNKAVYICIIKLFKQLKTKENDNSKIWNRQIIRKRFNPASGIENRKDINH